MSEEMTQAQIIRFTSSKQEDGMLAVDLIAKNSSLSKIIIKKLMAFGAVSQSHNGKKKPIRKAKAQIKFGTSIECYYDPKINLDQNFNFRKIREAKNYSVYHKPVGALTEGNKYGDQISLLRYVSKFNKHTFLVNRLDMETEGLIIIAHDSKTQNLFQSMWREGVTKKYQAIVFGKLEGSGEFTQAINNKYAKTKYESIEELEDESYVEITPISERKHQIRIHFANAGYPIIGDPIYGKFNKNRDGLQLVCYSLEFKDPYSGKEVEVHLPEKRLLF